MEPKDLDDPRNRRPAVPPEEKQVNVRRQVPARGLSDGGGDEPYEVDPQQEPAHAPDEERTGAVADRARGERALFDREDANPDEDLAREDAEEALTRDEPPAEDEVEVRRRGR